MINQETLSLLKDICPDFAPYNFFKCLDLYKGKIIGGYNIYYKKGDNDTEGIITGKNNIKKFGLDKFPYNFKTSKGFGGSKDEYGWTGNEMINVLKHIKLVLISE